MEKRKTFLTMLCACILCFVWTVSSPAAEQITLRLSHTSVKDKMNIYSQYAEKFAELIKKYTNDKVVIRTFGEGEIYKNYALMTRATMSGDLDLCFTIMSVAYPSSGIPEAGVPMIPRLIKTKEGYYRFLNDKRGGGVIDALAEKKNVKRLDSVIVNQIYIQMNRPVSKPEDFKGSIMRLAGGSSAICGKALGISASPISVAEMYSALQQKVIDGTATSLDNYFRRKLNEVIPYVVAKNWRYCYYTCDLLINTAVWNRLSPDIQEALKSKVIPELHAWADNASTDNMKKEEAQMKEEHWVVFSPDVVQKLDSIIENAYLEIGKTSATMSQLISVAKELDRAK